jgi:LacI family transcriptional regulator
MIAEPITVNGRITIAHVANEARVSPGTVSRVLHNSPSVDEEIRSRVLSAVKTLGYIHIPKKRATVNGEGGSETQLKSVVLCVREMETPAPRNVYYSHVLHGAETECSLTNLNMVYTTIKDTPASLPEIEAVLKRGQSDGVVLVGLNNHELLQQVSAKVHLPVVLINNYFPDLQFDSIVCDFYQGTVLAMRHLISLGHRDIVFVQGPLYDYSVQRRAEGYYVSLIQANLPFRSENVFTADLTIAGGEKIGRQILQSGVKFTAVCASNDATAIGIVRALNAAGLSVPDDISVVGFDDLEVASLVSPPLTTIHSDIEALGSIAVERLVQRALRPDRPLQQILLGTRLIERASTRAI